MRRFRTGRGLIPHCKWGESWGTPKLRQSEPPAISFCFVVGKKAGRSGDAVTPDDLLATIVDPLTDVANQVVSPYDGDAIGMAVPQPVLWGYALFHIGVKSEDAR